MQVCTSLWIIAKIKTREMSVWAKFAKISSRENFYGKSILQVPDTGTRVLDNTRPFLRSSIVSFWMTPARSKKRNYHIFRQYSYTKNFPVFTNTGTFQYLGPEVYFFHFYLYSMWPQVTYYVSQKENIKNLTSCCSKSNKNLTIPVSEQNIVHVVFLTCVPNIRKIHWPLHKI